MSALERILAIDIGLTGAIASLDVEKHLLEVLDMPVLADGPARRRTINGPLLAELVSGAREAAR